MTQLIHHWMLSSAERQPDAEAIRTSNQSLSYRNLRDASQILASQLKQVVVSEEQCIGLYLGKSAEAIAAIYAVLMAGAVYVPMDIKNPSTRIQYIVDQCQMSVVITTPELLQQLRPMLADARQSFTILVICNSHPGFPLDQFHYIPVNIHAPVSDAIALGNSDIAPNQLATTLFTSGSTGLPKGAMISHESVSIFVAWVIEHFQLTPADRCISHAPLHFDLSLLDIFATHAAGACAVLVPDAMSGNPKFITQYIAQQQVSVWQSVPSVLVLLLKYGDIAKHSYPSLRHILFAGERVSGSLLENLSVHFSNAAFHNIYGATETNDTFIFSIPPGNQAFPDPLPIGKPLPYVDHLIVDAEGNPVDGNEEGELLVSTPTSMRGYRNTLANCWVACTPPGETAPHDFYITKDIVRKLPDGNLLFCGRKDDIVKTSGNRVNLLEIENLLQTHPGISDVAVIPLPDDEIGNRILAIFTAAPGCKPSIIELKMFCANNLPKYAIPHVFELSELPLPKTSSGKTNKPVLIKSRGQHVATA